MTAYITDRIDLLVQAQLYWRWCWDCGTTGARCREIGEISTPRHPRKCCPDCRHPRVEKDIDDVQLVALGNYLCEIFDRCTCAAPVYGDQIMHESGCGLEPVYPLDKVRRALARDDAEARQSDIRHAELQARANAYYEAALSHESSPDRYKYFFDKRQELLSEMENL